MGGEAMPQSGADMPAGDILIAEKGIDDISVASPEASEWFSRNASVAEGQGEPGYGNASGVAPRLRQVERRHALVATPSPVALAMPLDGPAVAHTQALLPASAAPTFNVRYKELTEENL
jgi:hypothetical protein